MKEATSACHPSHINTTQQQTTEHPTLTITLHGGTPRLSLWGEARKGRNNNNNNKSSSFALNRPGNVHFIGQEEAGGREVFRHRSTPSIKLLPATPVNEEDLALGVHCAAFSCVHRACPNKALECIVEWRLWKRCQWLPEPRWTQPREVGTGKSRENKHQLIKEQMSRDSSHFLYG